MFRDDLGCYPARFAPTEAERGAFRDLSRWQTASSQPPPEAEHDDLGAALDEVQQVFGKPPEKPKSVIIANPKRYECHVTIEPVFDQLLEDVKALAEAHGFRVADLIFQKRAEDTPERSKRDTFMTRNTTSEEGYNELITSALKLRDYLENGLHVKVWRIKVEEILFDRKYHGVQK